MMVSMSNERSQRARRRRTAWAVPAAAAVAVGAAVVVPSVASADAHPSLPSVTAEQLLTQVQSGTTRALSGTVVETVRLGLPALPGGSDSASLSWQSLVQGTHEARVWVDGPDRQRIAVVGTLAESDVARDGQDLWTYASDTTTATHTLLTGAEHETAGGASAERVPAQEMSPQALSAQVLAAVGPSTTVSVSDTAKVAGRAAYTLSLVPKGSGSTVHRVLIAVDAATKVPLRVQVFAAAAAPALEASFTSVSFTAPAASEFTFTPPAGTTVRDETAHQHSGSGRTAPAAGADDHGTAARPTVHGTGWSSIVEFPAGTNPLAAAAASGPARGGDDQVSSTDLLNRLTTTLPNGDRLLRTALVNVLQTADGRVFAGAVDASLLESTAAGE